MMDQECINMYDIGNKFYINHKAQMRKYEEVNHFAQIMIKCIKNKREKLKIHMLDLLKWNLKLEGLLREIGKNLIK